MAGRELFHIVGDGIFFESFYVEADCLIQATAHARDILAGADRTGKRFYGTVDQHIIKVHGMGVIDDDAPAEKVMPFRHDSKVVFLK